MSAEAGRRAATAIALFVLLTACAGGAPAGSGRSAGPRRIVVVAAENFYGDIASQIGGLHVAVTSILTDPNADPHLFEPGTATGAAVAAGRVVIENGLGFQLVPWQPILEKRIGQHITGLQRDDGGIEWTLGRNRGLSL